MAGTTWDSREESRYANREGWRSGEWDNEPDRIEWRWLGPPRLACLIARGWSGALCGYVGVPPEHPLYGASCEDVRGTGVEITYSGEGNKGGVIDLEPRAGESDEEMWWLGFHCAYANDVSPAFPPIRLPGITYKNVEYVRVKVEELAALFASMMVFS